MPCKMNAIRKCGGVIFANETFKRESEVPHTDIDEEERHSPLNNLFTVSWQFLPQLHLQ